jgi:hypothetical protein
LYSMSELTIEGLPESLLNASIYLWTLGVL